MKEKICTWFHKKTPAYKCCEFHYQFSDLTSYTETSSPTLPFVYLPVKQTVTFWIKDLKSALGKIFNPFVCFLSNLHKMIYNLIITPLVFLWNKAHQHFNREQPSHSLKRKGNSLVHFLYVPLNTRNKLKLQFPSTQLKNLAPLIFEGKRLWGSYKSRQYKGFNFDSHAKGKPWQTHLFRLKSVTKRGRIAPPPSSSTRACCL